MLAKLNYCQDSDVKLLQKSTFLGYIYIYSLNLAKSINGILLYGQTTWQYQGLESYEAIKICVVC